METLKEYFEKSGQITSDIAVADLQGKKMIARGYIIDNPETLEDILENKATCTGPRYGTASLFSNRVVDKRGERWPLFSSVKRPDIIEVDFKRSYIPALILKTTKHLEKFKSLVKWNKVIDEREFEGVMRNESSYVYYIQEGDMMFESNSSITAIGKGFAVLCYTRTCSDEVSYEIHDPNSLIILPYSQNE